MRSDSSTAMIRGITSKGQDRSMLPAFTDSYPRTSSLADAAAVAVS